MVCPRKVVLGEPLSLDFPLKGNQLVGTDDLEGIGGREFVKLLRHHAHTELVNATVFVDNGPVFEGYLHCDRDCHFDLEGYECFQKIEC